MSDAVLHFAYGSNMDSKRLNRRIGLVSSAERASLHGFRFEFNKMSYRGDQVYANIMIDSEAIVWGVLMEITPEQLAKLDEYEGVEEGHYRREKVVVLTDLNEEIEAITYIAQDKWLKEDMRPEKSYLDYVLNGAVEFQVPQQYVERILEISRK